MELRNSRVASPNLDQSQSIQKTDGDGSNTVAAQAAVVADGGGGGLKLDLGNADKRAEVVKKKRGRPPKAQANQPAAKKSKEEDEEEDVCFICFDGGSLVLCDRRGCPKAYHPSCIKRDEAFFRSKAKWNCGWHICSRCEKAAHHMCYTCTFSLCKGCIRQSDYVCVRGDKGFCTVCLKTIMLIENTGDATVDFDDKTSWEYLFKVYWLYLKGKLSLTFDELTRAKNPWKLAYIAPTTSHVSTVGRRSITSELSSINLEANESKRRKTDEQPNGPSNDPSINRPNEWASKELMDLVAHMKNGETSVLSQFDVQALLLEYIKRNNLRDPRKKTQIICDLRLMNLFGKPRVGHIEMLKLLDSHFIVKKDPIKDTTDNTAKQGDTECKTENETENKESRNQKKGEKRITQNKLDEYAAIDVHNMNLIYLRRDLMASLIGNDEKFHEKVVGSIVQIRISGSDQKDDMYRLVQVVGTTKVDVPYRIGSKLVNVMLEVLNLDKKETVSIDTISNQELCEDECRRLRESIRCRLVRCFTVGEIQEKAMVLQSMLLDDRIKTEVQRLNQLRDQASEKGQKKNVRECVQKLKILITPEERDRRLREIPEVHSDPKMNPDYESDDTEEYFNNEHGEHQKLKFPWVSSTNTVSPTTKADSLNDQPDRPDNSVVIVDEESSKPNTGKDLIGLTSSVKPQSEADYSTGPKCNPKDDVGSSLSNVASELKPVCSVNDGMWHYRDPCGNVQGPFSMVQLQKWSTNGYFPDAMRIWVGREVDSVLLNDVLQEDFHSSDGEWPNKVACNSRDEDQVRSVTACIEVPSPNVPATSSALDDSVNLEKLPNDLNCDPPPVAALTESTKQFGVKNMPDINQHVSSVFSSDALQKEEICENPKIETSLTESTKERSNVLVQDPRIHNMPDINQHVPSAFSFADTSLVDLPNPLPEKESRKNPKIRSSRKTEHSKSLVHDSGIHHMSDMNKIQNAGNKEHLKLSVQDSGIHKKPDSSQHVSLVFDFADASVMDLPSPLQKKERNMEHSELSVQDSGTHKKLDSSQHVSSVFDFAEACPVDLPSPLQKKKTHESLKIEDPRDKGQSKHYVQDLRIHSMPDSSQHVSSVSNFADASPVDLPSPLPKKESLKIEDSSDRGQSEHSVQDSGIYNMPDYRQRVSSVFDVADASPVDLPSPLQKKRTHERPKLDDSRDKGQLKRSVQDSGMRSMPDYRKHVSSDFSYADASPVDLPSPLQKKESHKNMKVKSSRNKEHSELPVQYSGIRSMPDSSQHTSSVFNFSDASLVGLPSPLQKKKTHESPKIDHSGNKGSSQRSVQDSGIRSMPDYSQHVSSGFSIADASHVDIPSPLPKKENHKSPKIQSSRNKEHSKLSVQDSGIHSMPEYSQHVSSGFTFADASHVDLPSPLPKKESHKNLKQQSSRNKEHSKLSVQDSRIQNIPDASQRGSSVFASSDASLVDSHGPLQKKKSHESPKTEDSRNKDHSTLLVQDSSVPNMPDSNHHISSVFTFADTSLVDLPSPLTKKERSKNQKIESSRKKEHSKLSIQDSRIHNMPDSSQHASSVFTFADTSLVDLPNPVLKTESHESRKPHSRNKEHLKVSVQDSGSHNMPDINQLGSSVFSYTDLMNLPSPLQNDEESDENLKIEASGSMEYSKPSVLDSRIHNMPHGSQHVSSVFSCTDPSLVDLPSPLRKKEAHESMEIQNSRDKNHPQLSIQDLGTQNMPPDINQHVPSFFTVADAALADLASPLPRKETHENRKIEDSGNKEESKLLVQDPGGPPSWSTTLSLVIGGTHLPDTGEWGRYPPAVDHQAATTSSAIDQMSHLPSWHGLGETIEFSTLAEESVSDLLAEVDAMESRNGVPSPTSRRNSFLEDLFNGSIDDFSPTAEQGTRSDGFSSTADIHLSRQSTGFQFSFGLETRPVGAVSITQTSVSDGFKWADLGSSDLHPPRQDMIDLNDSTRAEADEGERETVVEEKSTRPVVRAGGPRVGRESKESVIKTEMAGAKIVRGFLEEEEEEGEFIQPEVAPPPPQPLPPPPQPLPPLLPLPSQPPLFDTVDSRKAGSGRQSSHGTAGRAYTHTSGNRSGNAGWESQSHQHRRSGGDRDRYNSISKSISPRERSHRGEDSGYSRSSKASWGRQSSFGSGGSSGGGGGYSRPPPKGPRVCKYYESGRCRNGSACSYLHPQNR